MAAKSLSFLTLTVSLLVLAVATLPATALRVETDKAAKALTPEADSKDGCMKIDLKVVDGKWKPEKGRFFWLKWQKSQYVFKKDKKADKKSRVDDRALTFTVPKKANGMYLEMSYDEATKKLDIKELKQDLHTCHSIHNGINVCFNNKLIEYSADEKEASKTYLIFSARHFLDEKKKHRRALGVSVDAAAPHPCAASATPPASAPPPAAPPAAPEGGLPAAPEGEAAAPATPAAEAAAPAGDDAAAAEAKPDDAPAEGGEAAAAEGGGDS